MQVLHVLVPMESTGSSRSTDLGPLYRWRSKDGEFWDPRKMKTSHLFHTVSMIWNHVMPEDARTHNYRRYEFGPFYTKAYLKISAYKLMMELFRRTDRTAAMDQRLQHMHRYLQGVSVDRLFDATA